MTPGSSPSSSVPSLPLHLASRVELTRGGTAVPTALTCVPRLPQVPGPPGEGGEDARGVSEPSLQLTGSLRPSRADVGKQSPARRGPEATRGHTANSGRAHRPVPPRVTQLRQDGPVCPPPRVTQLPQDGPVRPPPQGHTARSGRVHPAPRPGPFALKVGLCPSSSHSLLSPRGWWGSLVLPDVAHSDPRTGEVF